MSFAAFPLGWPIHRRRCLHKGAFMKGCQLVVVLKRHARVRSAFGTATARLDGVEIRIPFAPAWEADVKGRSAVPVVLKQQLYPLPREEILNALEREPARGCRSLPAAGGASASALNRIPQRHPLVAANFATASQPDRWTAAVHSEQSNLSLVQDSDEVFGRITLLLCKPAVAAWGAAVTVIDMAQAGRPNVFAPTTATANGVVNPGVLFRQQLYPHFPKSRPHFVN